MTPDNVHKAIQRDISLEYRHSWWQSQFPETVQSYRGRLEIVYKLLKALILSLSTQSGIWCSTWSDGNGFGNGILSYFTVTAFDLSISMVVCHILTIDPAQLAIWQFGALEVSQTATHISNFVMADWISASSNE